jgi:DNA-binding FadR family transcriptional regulator
MQRRGDLHARVVDDLGEAIIAGRLTEGAIIDLSLVEQRLGVSRSVVREALRVMANLGLVEARHKVGTRVLPRSQWNLLHPQVITWRAGAADGDAQLRDLLQLRLAVEPLAARLAAGHLDPAELETLQHACNELNAAARSRDRERFLSADELFHATILSNCGNEIVARFQLVIRAALQARQHESRSMVTEQTPRSLALHRRLARALQGTAGSDAGLAGGRAERIARELVDLATAELGFGGSMTHD